MTIIEKIINECFEECKLKPNINIGYYSDYEVFSELVNDIIDVMDANVASLFIDKLYILVQEIIYRFFKEKGIYLKFTINSSKSGYKNEFTKQERTACLISTEFIWEYTEEGHDYWRELDVEFDKRLANIMMHGTDGKNNKEKEEKKQQPYRIIKKNIIYKGEK